MPYFLGQDDQKLAYVVNSRVVKTLSEVGFEPTPTFVDQNTPVRKSSTLESGALDRSAILTCHLQQGDEYLFSNSSRSSTSSVETPKTTTIRSMHVAFILPRTTRGTSSNGRALDSHSRGTGIDTPVLHTKIFFYPNHRQDKASNLGYFGSSACACLMSQIFIENFMWRTGASIPVPLAC